MRTDFEAGYDAALTGIYRKGGASAEFDLGREWTFSGRFDRLSLESRLTAYFGGDEFANFGIVNADAEWWGTRLQHAQSWAGFSVGRLTGDLAGTVNAWPFIHDLKMLLGERRHIIGSAEIHWSQFQAECPLPRLGRVSSVLRVDLLDVTPVAELRTWRPKLWGFGVDDLRVNSLDITHALLARVRLAPQVHWKSVSLQLALAQWVPLSVSRVSCQPTTGGDAGPSGGSSNTAKTWSGFTFDCSLRMGI